MPQNTIFIPADVPKNQHYEYTANYNAITHNSGKLLMLAGDQKLEHLNADFYGSGIDTSAHNPEHLFAIASAGYVGAFATHLGLIARQGLPHPNINYIVKLNGKTNLLPKETHDPLSRQLWTINDVIEFKKNSGLAIRGIGYTIYLGGEHEPLMLHEAAQAIYQAHQHGLITILWMYPRAHHIADECAFDLVCGAAGVASTLGADFAKINPPTAKDIHQQAEFLRVAVAAAGTTKIICAGGIKINQKEFLEHLYVQLHEGGTAGAAIGRNIFQHSKHQAVAFTKALFALIYENKNIEQALQLVQK